MRHSTARRRAGGARHGAAVPLAGTLQRARRSRTPLRRVSHRQRTNVARHKAKDAAALLERAGFSTEVDLRHSTALEGLLSASREREDSVLVVGRSAARSPGRAFEGSVAQGALNQARVPVLIVP